MLLAFFFSQISPPEASKAGHPGQDTGSAPRPPQAPRGPPKADPSPQMQQKKTARR